MFIIPNAYRVIEPVHYNFTMCPVRLKGTVHQKNLDPNITHTPVSWVSYQFFGDSRHMIFYTLTLACHKKVKLSDILTELLTLTKTQDFAGEL